MKKLIKYFAIVLLSILALIVLILATLSVKYSPRYVYRLAKYHVADVYDYIHFENRVIEASDSTFSFSRNLDEPYVESLFNDRVVASGFSSFNEWAQKSRTTALIMIRRDTILYEKYFNGFARDSFFHSQSVAKEPFTNINGGDIRTVIQHISSSPQGILDRKSISYQMRSLL